MYKVHEVVAIKLAEGRLPHHYSDWQEKIQSTNTSTLGSLPVFEVPAPSVYLEIQARYHMRSLGKSHSYTFTVSHIMILYYIIKDF